MKKVFSILRITSLCVLFSLILLLGVNTLTDILTPKAENRYYILEKYLENHPEKNNADVQVFGSCHSYTSFDPIYFECQTGINAFDYGNPSEIIPVTYARMIDQFKKHLPKVALVEIWGINPYNTYLPTNDIFGYYFPKNLERVGFSIAKQEVIRGFRFMTYADISFLAMNFPVLSYKDRLIDGSLSDLDFNYSFEKTGEYSLNYVEEMSLRFDNNGFKRNPTNENNDYPSLQSTVEEDCMEIEPEIERFIVKIIDLCKKRDVKLIFYRAPYISNQSELKKANQLKKICCEKDVLFLDLEKEIEYDYLTDFFDCYHLSESGAKKSTDFLTEYILDGLK